MVWSVLAESAPGTSHRKTGIPCQDAFRTRTFGSCGEWIAIAAADGAGSASRSELGANLACEAFVRRAEVLDPGTFVNRDCVTSLFSEVRAALVGEAERIEVPPREMACTALLAVVGPMSATFAQVGDGAIVIGEGEDHRVVFWPEPAEYANATDFLTDDRFVDLIRFETTQHSITEVAVLTDGLQRLALDYSSLSPYAPFFRPLFWELRKADNPESLLDPLRTFLDSKPVNDRTDDDKTLVLALRRI
jgi:Protein phosphatase 2C